MKYKLILIVGLLWSLIASANYYTLTLHRNDNMGSSGTLQCIDRHHCMYLIRSFEYRSPKGACNLIELRENGRLIYTRRYNRNN